MLSTAVPSRRRERKPSHHDSPLNQLIYSSFSVPAPQITHGMVIICLTLGLSEVLGKRDQSNSFKSSLLDCSYTGKFWRKSPVHLAGKNFECLRRVPWHSACRSVPSILTDYYQWSKRGGHSLQVQYWGWSRRWMLRQSPSARPRATPFRQLYVSL